MKIGFIGLGNVGGKLAGSLLRNKFDLTVRDLNEKISKSFIVLQLLFEIDYFSTSVFDSSAAFAVRCNSPLQLKRSTEHVKSRS